MPKSLCYEFKINDRGWRVELDVHSLSCKRNELKSYDKTRNNHKHKNTVKKHNHLNLKLDTPLTM